MTGKELNAELMTDVGYARPGDQEIAKKAYMLNLMQRILNSDVEIPKSMVHQAHTDLAFPWSRAIISTCFGHAQVTENGIPSEYLKK